MSSTGASSSTEGKRRRPWADWAFALSSLGWALAPIVSGRPWLNAPRLSLIALHGIAAWLFMRRRPLAAPPHPGHILAALPSFIFGGLAFKLAPPPQTWPLVVQLCFVAGAAWTFVSLSTLSKNFAIFPAVRGLTRHGPYSVMRHPAYAGELFLVASCCLAASAWWVWGFFLLAALAIALRIEAEERLLARSSPRWHTYRDQVRWRLIPWIW